METRKMLKSKIHQMELTIEKKTAAEKALKAEAEKLTDELDLCRDYEQKFNKAMITNRTLIRNLDELKAQYDELTKTYKLVENALEGSTRERKKMFYENQTMRRLLDTLGYTVEHKDGTLVISEKEKANEG